MMTSVATSTATTRVGLRHDQPARSAGTRPTVQPTPRTAAGQPHPRPDTIETVTPADMVDTVDMVGTVQNVTSVDTDRGCDAAPIIDLTDLLVGIPDVPCRDGDAELWFAESPEDVEFAKSLCGTCPVRDMCLHGALARREPWGVWGGELFVMGRVVARKRPRGRPRKDAVA